MNGLVEVQRTEVVVGVKVILLDLQALAVGIHSLILHFEVVVDAAQREPQDFIGRILFRSEHQVFLGQLELTRHEVNVQLLDDERLLSREILSGVLQGGQGLGRVPFHLLDVGREQEHIRHLVTIASAHHVLVDRPVVHRRLLEAQRAVEDRHRIHGAQHHGHLRCGDEQLPCPAIHTGIEVADSGISGDRRPTGDVGHTLRAVPLLHIELIGLHEAGGCLFEGVRNLRVQGAVGGEVGVNVATVAPRLLFDVGFLVENGLVDELGRLQVIAVLVGIVGTDDVFLGEEAQGKHGHDGHGGLDVEHGISLNRVQI